MRRLGLLVAGAGLWLFLAAIPALADGGPHVVSVNSGTSTLTADSCAGCHRAHTAQGEYLLAAQSEEALCLSCHDGTGATANVVDGIQYVPTGLTGAGAVLGALRDGGFTNARIDSDSASRMAYLRNAVDVSQRPKVPVLGAGLAVTSAHIDLNGGTGDGIADTGILWGKGTQANGVGTPTVTLTCVECHNPHGNGQYRILRPVPGIEASPIGTAVSVDIKATYGNADTLVTDTQHGLVVWDEVAIAGVTGLTNGTYYVQSVTNGFTFKISLTLGGSAITTIPDFSGAGATVVRPDVAVADAPVDSDGNSIINSLDTRNYTVIQTKGSQGVNSTYLLYAKNVIDAAAGAGVAADQTPVVIDQTIDTGEWFETPDGVAHGLAVGDLVDLAGGPWGLTISNPYTVASVGSSTGSTVYDRFTLVGVTVASDTTDGTVVRKGIPGTYTAAGGDYFRRLVPWNPALVNSSCLNTVYSTTNSAYCGTANDAPNGRPATITSGPTSLVGQQAFLDQMSTWCMTCHTRYYSASNENVLGDPPISTLANVAVSSSSGADITSGGSSPSYGDKVTFSNVPGGNTLANATEYFVIATASGGKFQVAATMAGTAITPTPALVSGDSVTFTRTYQSSNSSWGYPRTDGGVADPTYKYQHSTASNRGCTVCHVGHGSNAVMSGTFSLGVPYPNGTTTSSSSRLLKVDNRGTCQMCHDPTSTVTAGTLVGPVAPVP